ncbi:lipopolysaccharide biosynthesis protein, partial [Francisella tularensis subsp. holarctica]|nr:lipopolysaccharide biosynthesis protein [Francisella tularensis subsp. holarctica]
SKYITQLYTSLIVIVILPLYLHHLSHDAFGLFGFFTVFQTWLRLLDVCITTNLSREVAHVRVSTDDYHYLRKLVRSLE